MSEASQHLNRLCYKNKQPQTKDNQIEDYQVRIGCLQGRVEKLEQELATVARPRLLLPSLNNATKLPSISSTDQRIKTDSLYNTYLNLYLC